MYFLQFIRPWILMWTSRPRLFRYKIMLYADISHQGKSGLLICAQPVAVRLHVCPTYTILNTPKCKVNFLNDNDSRMIQDHRNFMSIDLHISPKAPTQATSLLKDQATFANISSWTARPELQLGRNVRGRNIHLRHPRSRCPLTTYPARIRYRTTEYCT